MDAGEAVHVVERIGGVVEIELGMDLRDHAPHRLAQERGAFHGAIAPPQRGVGRAAEIGRQHPLFLRHVELVVGGEVGEIEERRVEAGIVPVDQPDAGAVVDEIAGEQVVVAEDEIDRPDGEFEAGGDIEQVGQARGVLLPPSSSVWA